jgi:mRNA-degrading endonuclease RelE of RelBE toxin-antitoxin system
MTMNARTDEALIEKLKSLPPQRRAQVEDFVDFLKSREDERRVTHAAAQATRREREQYENEPR